MRRNKGKSMPAKLNLSSNSSQAALEFLMTYGWAVLIVMVAIGTLSYFGVLSLDKFVPSSCVFPAGVACLDYKVESYRVIFVLKNTYGESITINKATVSQNNVTCFDNESITLKNQEKVVFTIEQCNNGMSGKKFDGSIDIIYVPENGVQHNALGKLRAKIVEGSSFTSPAVCQNAQNDDFCDGLDIVFGVGYKASCCSEHNLCC